MSCNIGPDERAVSRNMDRSRMSGIGKLHDDSHVPCNNMLYGAVLISYTTYYCKTTNHNDIFS